MKYIINQTELTTICMSGDLVPNMISLLNHDKQDSNQKLFRLKNIVSFEDVDTKNRQALDEHDVKLITYKEVLEAGKKAEASTTFNVPQPEDIFMLSYTSGTTGDPKGVKLSHRMVVGCAASVNWRIRPMSIREDDTYISYLPAAHSFEQALFSMSLIYGTRQGFYGGDPKKMAQEDLPYLQPTFFPSVPRLYNVFYGRITDKVAEGGIGGWLLSCGLSSKIASLQADGSYTHCFYDKIVFSKLKALLGGKVRLMLTGSAPIDRKVMETLKVAFACPFLEGYGMTETAAGSVIHKIDEREMGHVGGPVANVKIRFKDIPEMGYSHANTPCKGEVCFQGSSIMSGYYKNPEKTNETIIDGWLHSGDVGELRPDGSIKIVDRAKNIFKLSQGEYIAPEKLENVYVQSKYIDGNPWVHGDSLHDYTLIFINPQIEWLEKWAQEKGISVEDAKKHADFKQLVMQDIYALADKNKFNSLEKPGNIWILNEPFTVENNMITSTFKLKRNEAKKAFAKEIEELYAAGKMKVNKPR